jgi:hypothetical protein
MGSETDAPNLFWGQTEAETAVGTILGRGLGRFGSGFDGPAGSTDPLAYGILFTAARTKEMVILCVKERKNANKECFWLFRR